MKKIQRAEERGHADYGWLDTHHSFSFANWYEPKYMGFRALRVLNEDRVAPGAGFPTHPHRDMEIVSYVLEGALEHQDSMGHGSVIRPGEVQRMSAGTGVTHSEYNASREEGVHFLQIWILPEAQGLEPTYEQKHFPDAERTNALRLVASRDGRDGSVTVHQDLSMYAARLAAGASVEHALERPFGYVFVARGAVQVGGETLHQGDSAAITEETDVSIVAVEEAEILLFDLA